MQGKLLFLGTGSSAGVPLIGCSCPVCSSTDKRNQRLRSSVLISYGHQQFLIDVGPDFREQALKYNIKQLDGIIITHTHYDHTSGLDDLRPIRYEKKAPLPILASHESLQDIKKRFYYLFPEKYDASNPFEAHCLPHPRSGEIEFENNHIRYTTYEQGKMHVNGFQFGNLAYLCDIRQFSEDIFNSLSKVKILVIGALKYVPSLMHFSVDEAIDFASKLNVDQVWLTHLSHEIEYTHASAYLPPHIRLAYDGLEIEFDTTDMKL